MAGAALPEHHVVSHLTPSAGTGPACLLARRCGSNCCAAQLAARLARPLQARQALPLPQPSCLHDKASLMLRGHSHIAAGLAAQPAILHVAGRQALRAAPAARAAQGRLEHSALSAACWVQGHQNGAALDGLRHLAVSDVLAPALAKLFTQAVSRARHTPRRQQASAQKTSQRSPWAEVEEHAAASGAASAAAAGPSLCAKVQHHVGGCWLSAKAASAWPTSSHSEAAKPGLAHLQVLCGGRPVHWETGWGLWTGGAWDQTSCTQAAGTLAPSVLCSLPVAWRC